MNMRKTITFTKVNFDKIQSIRAKEMRKGSDVSFTEVVNSLIRKATR